MSDEPWWFYPSAVAFIVGSVLYALIRYRHEPDDEFRMWVVTLGTVAVLFAIVVGLVAALDYL